MIKINGRNIDLLEVEWGVEFHDDDNEVAPMDSETEARATALFVGGTLVARRVYTTAWAEVETE